MSRLFNLILGLAATLLGVSWPSAAAAPPSGSSTPARDSFQGTLSGGTGAYRGAHGTLSVLVDAPGPTGARRRLTLRISSATCRGCLRMSGVLEGYMTPGRRQTPDTGSNYSIVAAGRLHNLGSTRTTGTATGTGFIARGRETMQLTLRTSRGSVMLNALSGEVSGFSSP